ncbi:MAG: pilus assembly protein PilM [Bdellovibrionales bacterium]
MKSFGIDIGSHSIKIAEIESSSSGANLLNYIELPIPMQPNTDVNLAIIDSLRSHFEKVDTTNLQIAVAINQNFVTHRRTFFPFKVRHSIQRALPLEIEDEVPFSPDNAIFDAKILSYQSGGGANVLASISPKDRIAECLQTCKDSGLEPSIVSCETLSYSNLFENWKELPPERTDLLETAFEEEPSDENENSPKQTVPQDASALIHIGHSKTLLMVYQNKELLTCRTISWGGKLLAEEVHKKYQLPLSESIKELESKGFILLSNENH